MFNLFVVNGELPQFSLIGPSGHLLEAVGRQGDGGPLVGPVSQQIEDGRLLPPEVGAQALPEFRRRLGIRQRGVDENTQAGSPLSVSPVLQRLVRFVFRVSRSPRPPISSISSISSTPLKEKDER